MVNIADKKYRNDATFEIALPSIHAIDVKEIINTDIIVAGGGLSGLCAAISAAEMGAKVVLLEKGDKCHAHGHGNAAIGSKMQKERGIEIDRDGLIDEIMRWGAYRSDQKLINFWADNCGKVMDWLLEIANEANIEVITMEKTQPDLPGYFQGFGLLHEFLPDGQLSLINALDAKMRAIGVDAHFETQALKLIKSEKGRVTGVIASTKAGYKQFNGRAVVLSTGGYEHDQQMLQKYAPEALNTLNKANHPPLNTGDGHKMALQIGAVMEQEPHCCVFEDGGGEHLESPGTHLGVGLARHPWLNVNKFGERYFKEDVAFTFVCNANMAQPDHITWVVWDGKWEEETKRQNRYKGVSGKHVYSSFHRTTPELYQEMINKGAILKIDNLKELADKMEVHYETFIATIKRYNEITKLGKDLDFCKNPKLLTTIEKPPFYAAKSGAALLVTLGGLKINNSLQVLDKGNQIIPGLYAAGNVSGGFFGRDYPCSLPGLTHSRAFTFGRLAGLKAAEEKGI